MAKKKGSVTSVLASHAPLPPSPESTHDYQAEEDGRHLMHAAAVKADGERHRRALEHLKTLHKHIGGAIAEHEDHGGNRYGQGYRRVG